MKIVLRIVSDDKEVLFMEIMEKRNDLDTINVSDTDNAVYKLGLLKFKDQSGNISTIRSFEEFDKAMSDPNTTFIFE